MDLKKRYYDYAKKHTEEELWRLFNEDLKNNVNSGSDYFSCDDYANLIKKVYCKNVVLSDSQMMRISLDVIKYAIFYQDKVNDRSFYFSHKQNVIMTYVFLVLCRNSGIDKFELNDKQKMYKIITIIKNALADFCVGYYIKNDRSTATYYLASIDDDG